jgi:hypothetical protein
LQATIKHSHIPDIAFIMAITAIIHTIITATMVIVTFRTPVCTIIDTSTVALLGYMATTVMDSSTVALLGYMACMAIGTFIMVLLVSTAIGTFIQHSPASMDTIATGTFLTAL